jgi:hypothetical protein
MACRMAGTAAVAAPAVAGAACGKQPQSSLELLAIRHPPTLSASASSAVKTRDAQPQASRAEQVPWGGRYYWGPSGAILSEPAPRSP